MNRCHAIWDAFRSACGSISHQPILRTNRCHMTDHADDECIRVSTHRSCDEPTPQPDETLARLRRATHTNPFQNRRHGTNGTPNRSHFLFHA